MLLVLGQVTGTHIEREIGVVELLLGTELRPLIRMHVRVLMMRPVARVLLLLLAAGAVKLSHGLSLPNKTRTLCSSDWRCHKEMPLTCCMR